jgi:hypothetical protein
MSVIHIKKLLRADTWTLKEGSIEHRLDADDHGLNYMRDDGGGFSGFDCYYQDFLDGDQMVDVIRTVYGAETLKEVAEVVAHNMAACRPRGH